MLPPPDAKNPRLQPDSQSGGAMTSDSQTGNKEQETQKQ